jgi:protein TonB
MLEVKKSKEADLERRWLQRFLLGLAIALAVFFIALEYPLTPDDPLDDPDLLEQFAMDPELSSLLRPENELALAPKAEPKPTTRLVVADKETEPEPQQEETPMETDAGTDMEAQEDEELPPPEDDDEVKSIRVVEDLPQFPGGPVEMMIWLTRNLKYPKQSEQLKQQGKVVAEFIVNKDGSITDVHIVASLTPLCDREVLRVLRMMPRWTAGVMDGQPCRTKVCIPVVFRL